MILKPDPSHCSPKRTRPRERGQSIVLIAVAFVGLIAFVGLTVDAGLLFIGYGHLRRAVDAAAISAATQFRENYTLSEMQNAATEYLRLNGVDMDNASAEIFTCATSAGDPNLCTTPKRKLVRVVGHSKVDFAFLPVLGIYNAPIIAEAYGEAASMDVVLVIDISESMTEETDWDEADDPNFYLRDPSVCNDIDPDGTDPAWGPGGSVADNTPGECHPFEEVKQAAKQLALFILNKPAADEEDRLSLVIFSNGWESGENRGTYTLPFGGSPAWYTSYSGVGGAEAAINSLEVYEAGVDCIPNDITVGVGGTNPGICRRLDGAHGDYNTNGIDDDFNGMGCPRLFNPAIEDQSSCTTTNIGGGMKLGAGMFGHQPHMESLWVLILLTDGAANATCLDEAGNTVDCIRDPVAEGIPLGYCPNILRDPAPDAADIWYLSGAPYIYNTNPACRDSYVSTRHSPAGSVDYDADDYAMDAADFAACDGVMPAAVCNGLEGQGAVMFSIGLGPRVLSPVDQSSPPKPYGEALLRYIAHAGIDWPGGHNPCYSAATGTSCGSYFYAPTGSALFDVFDEISSRIFTRITK
jgi:hypothetical protein